MGKFVDLMYQSVGTTIDSETAMTDYVPPIDARLKKVIVVVGQIAATSLAEAGYIRISSPTFGGVDMIAKFNGIGLRTVPAQYIPPCETECDLAVKSGNPLKGKYYWNVTPVTPELFVYGEFEA